MTMNASCLVCKNPDRRRITELGWNGGMSAEAIARTLDVKGLAITAVLRHMKEHADGDAAHRHADIEPELPTRERVLNLQRMQLDEVERRITLAKQTAERLNAVLEEVEASGMEGAATTPRHDWSEFFDILGKDGQSAIGSILKAQGLTDKRDMKRDDLKLGLFEAMQRGGLAPKELSGGGPAPQFGVEHEGNDEDETD